MLKNWNKILKETVVYSRKSIIIGKKLTIVWNYLLYGTNGIYFTNYL